MPHRWLPGGWLALAGLALVLAMDASSQAADDIVAQAFLGQPLGAGRIELRRPPDLREDQALRQIEVRSPNGRLLYPAVVLRPETIEIYFLLAGDAPLTAEVLAPGLRRVEITPARHPALSRQLTTQWWGAFLEQSQRATQRESPPQTYRYLLPTLARRLELPLPPAPTPASSFTKYPEAENFLAVLLGVASVRAALARDALLDLPDRLTSAELTRPLPQPAAPLAMQFELPADVTVEAMAQHVPEECFYVRTGSYTNFAWLLSSLEQWTGDLRDVLLARGVDAKVDARIQEQLGLRDDVAARLAGGFVIADVALIGSDLFFEQGAGIGFLFQAQNNDLLRGQFESQRKAAAAANPQLKLTTLQLAGKDVTFLASPDGRVRSYYAVDGDFHLITNSQTIARRFLEAGQGIRPLGKSAEFRHARTVVPTDRNGTAFVYLSDPFIRQLVGPQYRVEMTRRMQADAELELTALARLAAQAEGRPADTVAALVEGGFLPARFGERADGSRPQLVAGKQVDSLRGARGFFLPVVDVPIAAVTPAEEAAYVTFREFYEGQWQRMDPIVISLERKLPAEGQPGNGKLIVELHATPYVREHYALLSRFLTEPSPRRLAPIDGDLVTVEGVGGPLQAQGRYVLGMRDFTPRYTLRAGVLDIMPADVWRDPPFYVAGPVNMPFWFHSQPFPEPDAEGFAAINTFPGWRRVAGAWCAFGGSRQLLADVTPQLKLVDAARPAQLRLRIADLGESKLAPAFSAWSYVQSRRVSEGNTDFLHELVEQFRVPADQTLAVAKDVLGGELACPLGGKYQQPALPKKAAPPVPPTARPWRSTAWPSDDFLAETEAPAKHVSGLLKWFRGLEAELSLTSQTLTGRIEVDLRP